MPKSSPLTENRYVARSGTGAPPRLASVAGWARRPTALDWLRAQHASRGLELLGIPARTDDLKAATKQAAALKGFATIAVLGIGGSSLGGQALTALRKVQKPFVEFHDNPDPFAWARALKRFDLKKTHFIAISKSGGTAETLMQVLTAAEALEKTGVKSLKKHFTIITEPHQSALADFADEIGAVKLDHPTGVGGRYSVLTMVGALPGLCMGLNFKQLRAGAQAALDQVLNAGTPADAPAAVGAALHQARAEQNKLATTILWPFPDALAVFGGWWRQLWAESLGKDGKGSTPVSVLGPVDQHSQLQLFRDGPGNALFTLMAVDTNGKGPTAPKARANKLGLKYLAGKKLGDLVDAEARATAQTLFKNGRPVRQIHLTQVDEFHTGALMMHFMLETIIMGRLMNVDPFDHPGVEEGKVLARQYLAEG
jgi:glucose-6-phosphate isomerase